MSLLKKVLFAGFISTAMLATTPSVMAKPAGKQANQSQEGVAEALDATVAAAEETLAALEAGVDMEKGLELFKTTKETSKTIESATVFAARSRAQGTLSKARSAFKKGENEQAITLMTEAVTQFKGVKDLYFNFGGDKY
ncbi:MAG: hypothetical protein IBX55_14075 [Methyloprofundus sp.]|nr:hypothetical protein [Methyloprofundus sp.]MBW6452874.1 hypothetical protein [Methyloprofundus sp.]